MKKKISFTSEKKIQVLQVQIVHFLVRKYYFEKAFPHYTEVLMLKKQLYGISGWEARLLGCKLIREQKIAKLTGKKKKWP